MKLKLDHVIPLFRNLQVPLQLSSIQSQSHWNDLSDSAPPDMPPLLHYKFVPKFVCILLLNGSDGRESACNAGGLGSIPGLGRSLEEGKGYPFQYSGLENSTDCVQSMGLQRVGHH